MLKQLIAKMRQDFSPEDWRILRQFTLSVLLALISVVIVVMMV